LNGLIGCGIGNNFHGKDRCPENSVTEENIVETPIFVGNRSIDDFFRSGRNVSDSDS
jgi:hypothetical protein